MLCYVLVQSELNQLQLILFLDYFFVQFLPRFYPLVIQFVLLYLSNIAGRELLTLKQPFGALRLFALQEIASIVIRFPLQLLQDLLLVIFSLTQGSIIMQERLQQKLHRYHLLPMEALPQHRQPLCHHSSLIIHYKFVQLIQKPPFQLKQLSLGVRYQTMRDF